MHFRELLHVDSLGTLNFFHSTLREEAANERVSDGETVYVASILASYAQTSRADAVSLPPLCSLSEVFDMFVLQKEALTDPALLEIAGAQSLWLAGFFRDQMRARHNVEWYDQLGTSFYERAEYHSEDRRRQDLFRKLAASFTTWTSICNRLNRTLRERRFLLNLD